MKIYRVGKTKYIDDLSGEGARLYGGRWNKKGDPVVYFSEHLSLCVLELLARLDYENLNEGFMFLEAEIPEKNLENLINPVIISKNWRQNPPVSETQLYGSNWLKNRKSLALTVPSAILPNEMNILINPRYNSLEGFKILQIGRLELDARII